MSDFFGSTAAADPRMGPPAQESGWTNLGRCEIFASLLRTNPAAFVLVNGQAQRFTTALIREVRWLAQSLQHLPSGPM